MKKLIAILLSLAMFVSLGAGCNTSGNGETQTTGAAAASLKVGYSRIDITPQESMLMSGGLTDRWSTGIEDPLYATCIAFTDGNNNTILLYSMDLTRSYDNVTPWARLDIQKATGVPQTNIMFSATHMHRGPKLQDEQDSAISNYIKGFRKKLVQVAEEAIADQKPAQMFNTSTRLEGFNFVRHYLMDDGSVIGDNFGTSTGKQFVKHMSEPDNEMQLIKFTREGGEDIVMVNWQAHPHRSGIQATTYSSDIVGAMRDEIEKLMNCKFAYFSGASGEVNSKSRINSENITKNYLVQGQEMAKIAAEALKNVKPVELGNLQITRQSHTGKPAEGRTSVLDFEMNVMTIGDIGFVFAPYEMFNANGMFIKENSPFEMTFVITYANQHLYYLPSANAFDYNAQYELKVTRYAPGTAEDLADKYVAMLKEVYPTRK